MILLSMVKKLTVFLLLFSVLLVNLFTPAVSFAQAPPGAWWAPSHTEFNTKVNSETTPQNEIFGERYTHAQVWWVVYSLINLAVDQNVAGCGATANSSTPPLITEFLTCLGLASGPGSTHYAGAKSVGLVDLAKYSDLMISTKPASGISYLASTLDNLGIPLAHAQESGFGFNALGPVLSLWTASRNAAYALVTLVIIILAFMIMFRTRISPQATVSVQYAIPRIIIGLLLITFSYAIAGFVIDMAYVVQGVTAAVISQSDVSTLDAVTIFNYMNNVGGGLFSFGLFILAVMFIPVAILGVALGSTVVGVPLAIAAIIIFILVLLIYLIAVVRIFWLFLRTYVLLVFQVIALPFGALGYIVSSENNMFIQLLKALVANISVFVVTSVVIMFAHVLLWSMAWSTWAGTIGRIDALNPYRIEGNAQAGIINVPGFSGVDISILAIFISTAVLLLAPSIANNVRAWILTGRTTGRMDMIGSGMAAAAGGLVGGAVGSGALKVGGTALEAWVTRRLRAADRAKETPGTSSKPPKG